VRIPLDGTVTSCHGIKQKNVFHGQVQARNQPGTLGEEFSERGPNFLNYVQ